MVEQLTYETIEKMNLEAGELVMIKRGEGLLPVALEGFQSALARSFPENTFVLLPPGLELEQVKPEELKALIEEAEENVGRAMPAYKIRSTGRSVDTKIIDPTGAMVGHVTEMHIVAKASDPLLRVKMLRYKTEDGKIVNSTPEVIAINSKIEAEQVEIIEKPLQVPPYIYVASSWRNEYQPEVVQHLRREGYDVYDFRHPKPGDNGFHWSEIDPDWKNWTPEQYREALDHPVAKAGFQTDAQAMYQADIFVGVQPFGRSASIEMGWAAGMKKPTILLLHDGEPELMVKTFDFICCNLDEVCEAIEMLIEESNEAS